MKNLKLQSAEYFLRNASTGLTPLEVRPKNNFIQNYFSSGRVICSGKSGFLAIQAKTQITRLLTGLIFLYQRTLSPDHGICTEIFGRVRCRFFPSCSEYTVRALSQYGLLKGVVVSLKRIARCGPWSAGGYDPVSSNRQI